VPDLKISFRKLNELQYECFQNALRLHLDSVLLAKARSFASAFAISVIASEELGKGFGIDEMSFQAGLVGGLGRFEEKKVLRALLSDHKLKQGWFASSMIGISGWKSLLKRSNHTSRQKQCDLRWSQKREPPNRTSVLGICIEGKTAGTNC
jgi:AbiV family abortive infection protein